MSDPGDQQQASNPDGPDTDKEAKSPPPFSYRRLTQSQKAPPPSPLQKARDAFIHRRYREVLAQLEEVPPEETDSAEVHLLRGRTQFHLLRLQEARRSLNRAAGSDAPRIRKLARFTLARLLMQESRWTQARDRLSDLVMEYPKDIAYAVHAHMLIATCLMQEGRVTAGETHREIAESFGLVSSELLVEHGRALVHAQQWDEAAAYFGEGATADPTNPYAYFYLSNLFYLHNQPGKAEEILAFGLEQAPEEVIFFTLLGDLRRAQKRYGDAVTLYRLALEISPKGFLADYIVSQVAQCLYLRGDYGEARSHFMVLAKHFRKSPLREQSEYYAERLATRVEDDRLTIENFPAGLQLPDFCGPKVIASVLGHYGQQADQSDIAAQIFAEGVEWPDVKGYLEGRGFEAIPIRATRERFAQLVLNQVPAIVSEFRGLDGHFLAVIGFDPKKDAIVLQDPAMQDPVDLPMPTFFERIAPSGGLCLVVLPGEWTHLREELELEPDPLMVAWLEAVGLRQEGELNAAAEKALEALQIDPQAEAPQKLLVEIALEMGDLDAAEERSRQILTSQPDRKVFWARKYLADVALRREQFAEAAKAYQLAKQWYRDDAGVWGGQALAYEKLGNLTRAKQAYKRCLELEPSATDALLQIADINLTQDRYQVAADALEAILDLEPGWEPAVTRLDTLTGEHGPLTLRQRYFAEYPPSEDEDDDEETEAEEEAEATQDTGDSKSE